MKSRRSVSISYRVPSAVFKEHKSHDESQTDSNFTESVCQYYQDIVEQSKQPESDLQLYPIKESLHQGLKSIGIRRKAPLTKGQQLSLLEKYHVHKDKYKKMFGLYRFFPRMNLDL